MLFLILALLLLSAAIAFGLSALRVAERPTRRQTSALAFDVVRDETAFVDDPDFTALARGRHQT
jgi:hypothetical protein